MDSRLSVEVDSKSLNTFLTLYEADYKVLGDIALSLEPHVDDLQRLKNGFILPWHEFLSRLVDVSRILKKYGIRYQFDSFSTTLLENYLTDKKYFNSERNHIDISEKQISSILTKNGFKRKLTDEQYRNLSKLLKLKHGANFSVPGAGKTTTTLALYTILKAKNYVDYLWVVSPINAFISWTDEIHEIFGDGVIRVYRLKSEDINQLGYFDTKSEIILANYEKMRKDVKGLFPFFIKNNIHLILDESHRIKSGEDNLSFLQLNRLSDIAVRRDILSGTPMPQTYIDLDAQFEFLWRKKFISAINVPEDVILEKVNESILKKYVRTTKEEIGLKDPIIEYKKVKLGPLQAAIYDLFKSETARQISGLEKGTIERLRSLGRNVVRLLQASTNPMLLGTNDDFHEDIVEIPAGTEIWDLLNEFSKYEKPAKIESLINEVETILEENSKNKIVIWSYFIRNIQLLERLLKEYQPVSIYGEIPSGRDDEDYREGRIRRFHDDSNCRLMIANPQACGEGISLHRASHYAIYLDRNFNAAYYLQSLDRIHRLGLDRDTDTVIKILIAENTIDEVLVKRLGEKTRAMGQVLNDKYLLALAYDPEDILLENRMGLDIDDLREIQKHVLS